MEQGLVIIVGENVVFTLLTNPGWVEFGNGNDEGEDVVGDGEDVVGDGEDVVGDGENVVGDGADNSGPEDTDITEEDGAEGSL